MPHRQALAGTVTLHVLVQKHLFPGSNPNTTELAPGQALRYSYPVKFTPGEDRATSWQRTGESNLVPEGKYQLKAIFVVDRKGSQWKGELKSGSLEVELHQKDRSAPASTDTKSDALPTLKERIAFLERYVTFRRDYSDVGFHVVYRNGGWFPPSPSEWDVRVVATVPPKKLTDWIPSGVKKTPTVDKDWLDGVPGAEKASGIHEWYAEPGRLVGIDREKSIVAYRTWKY